MDTQTLSRVENLTRRRPEFEPGEAGAEAAQLAKVERCRRDSNAAAADEVKNQLLRAFVYNRLNAYLSRDSQGE